MSGDGIETAIMGVFLAFGGLGFARLGLARLRQTRVPVPQPGAELTADASGRAGGAAMKALWLLCLLFGIFITGCGVLLALAGLFPPGAGQ